MNKLKVLGLIRHLLTAAGGIAVGLGYAQEGIVTEAIGAIMTLAGIVTSYYAPEKA